VAASVEKFGRLDVMLANAGYGFLRRFMRRPTRSLTPSSHQRSRAPGTPCRRRGVMLKQPASGTGKARRGHIIAVSSGAARRGLPLYGIYAMTKAAQLSLCEAMRVELMGRACTSAACIR